MEQGELEGLKNTTTYICLICNEPRINANKIKFDCSHEICIFCLEKMRHNEFKKGNDLKCPWCRNIIQENTNNLLISTTYDDNDIDDHYIHTSTQKCITVYLILFILVIVIFIQQIK